MPVCANELSITAPVAPVRDPWIGQATTVTRHRVIAGRYRVQRTLGQGGAAVVYEVQDGHSGERLALKQLLPQGKRLAFRREFHTLASLRHPNIVEVREFGVDGDRLYYTMELLDGRNLAPRRIGWRQVCVLLRDVASALAFLHARKLIHGDISRRNVGCTRDGTIKLLDFGLLATVGVNGRGGGTVPYVAPEVHRGLPLDHRVDLFSLGTLAYRLLTGLSAYRAANSNQLERAWSQRPAAPTELVPGVPAELGDLLISMTSVNPLARPTSAAEVIDRARALGRLRSGPQGDVVRGYLASSALIGRAAEMRQLRQAVADARRGRGGALVLSGPSGMGKTRILDELHVEAQLAGAQVLAARCNALKQTPYAVLHALVSPLLPADGAGSKLQQLERWADATGHGPEHRLLLQRRLARRILAEADQRPLVLLVDDLQRCDEASAAVLATVAHAAPAHRLVLATTLRSDEPRLAPGALATLLLYSRTTRLGGLHAQDVRDLLGAIFGEVDNLDHLARWVHDASDGSPLGCTELARSLVDRGVVRYEDGMWQIPRVGQLDPPGALTEVLERRVGCLSAPARRLAEALSVHGGEIDLEICVALSDAPDERAAFAALDELVQQEVLVGVGERLRFRHDGLREALLRRLGEERRRELHLQVGLLLLDNDGAGDEEVGWHLLQGGKALRAADLLERAGRRHFEAQAYASAAAPLETALQVLEHHGRGSVRQRCDLRQLLVRVGTICKRELVLRHGERAVNDLQRFSGVRLALRLGPLMGRHLALLVALLLCSARRLLTPPRRRGPPVLTALVRYITMINYTAVSHAISFDLEGSQRLLRLMEPVALISRRWTPYASYLLGTAIPLTVTGRWREARARLERSLRLLSRSAWMPGRRRFDVDVARGTARYALATLAAQQLDSRCLDEFNRLESMNLNFFETSARLGRLLFHRCRGEEGRARAVEDQVRLLLVQMGSMWPWESQLCWVSALAYCATRDLTAMKRSIGELEALVAQGMRLDPVVEICRGTYQAERGELESAHDILTRVAQSPGCAENPLLMQSALAALGYVLNLMGRHAEAETVARQGMALGQGPQTHFVTSHAINLSNLALAEASQGAAHRAARRLDAMLAQVPDTPLVCGVLHECWTRVALLVRDGQRVRHHLAETEYWFRITRNPALVARYEKLAAAVSRQGRVAG